MKKHIKTIAAITVIAMLFTFTSERKAISCAACSGCTTSDCAIEAPAVIAASHVFFGQPALTEGLALYMTDLKLWWSEDFFLETVLPDLKKFSQEQTAGFYQRITDKSKIADAEVTDRKNKILMESERQANKDYSIPMYKEGNPIGATATGVAALAAAKLPDGKYPQALKAAADGAVNAALHQTNGAPSQKDVQDNLVTMNSDTCTPTDPGCNRDSGSVDPDTAGSLTDISMFTSSNTQKLDSNTIAATLSIACTPQVKSPPLSAREIKNDPEAALNLTNTAWSSVVMNSCKEIAKLHLEQEADDPKNENILANYDNEELADARSPNGKLSIMTIFDALTMALTGKKNMMFAISDSKNNLSRATLSALMLQDIIQYEIYRSEQRQEMLVAGILIYELIEHKRWREQNEALRIANQNKPLTTASNSADKGENQ